MGFVLLALLCQDTIPDLVRKLGDDSIEVRERAARRLRAIGEEALPDLQAAAGDLDFQTRTAALLKQIERERWFDPRILSAYPEFATALLEDAPETTLQLAFRICDLEHSQESFEAYAAHLVEQPGDAARKAAVVFRLAARRSLPQLIRAIEEWDPVANKDEHRHSLQELVRIALDGAGAEDRPLLAGAVARHWESRQALAVLQVSVGIPEAIPTLVELLQKGTPWLRLPAIIAARKGRCLQACEPLILLLSSAYFGPDAARTLTELADESWRPKILEALGALTPVQRPAGHAALLARWGGSEALPLLREALATRDRGAAADALAERDPAIVDELLHQLEMSVARAVARLATAAHVAPLLAVLNGGAQRDAAQVVLASLRDPVARRELLRVFVKEQDQLARERIFQVFMRAQFLEADLALEALVLDFSDPLSSAAAHVLIRRNPKRGVAVIEDAVLAANGPIPMGHLNQIAQHPSERLVPFIRRRIPGADNDFGAFAVVYLGKVGLPEDLRALCGHPFTRVRREAAVALARATGEAHTALLDSEDGYPHYHSAPDLLACDVPGLRDDLRRRIKKDGLVFHLPTLRNWAHPEMAEGLLKILREWEGGLEERKRRAHPWCGTGMPYEPGGCDVLSALAGTGDRSLAPIFVDRLASPDPECQQAAIRICGEWKLQEAAPILRRLARVGAPEVRKQALAALEKN